jgi:hypothetical protein
MKEIGDFLQWLFNIFFKNDTYTAGEDELCRILSVVKSTAKLGFFVPQHVITMVFANRNYDL